MENSGTLWRIISRITAQLLKSSERGTNNWWFRELSSYSRNKSSKSSAIFHVYGLPQLPQWPIFPYCALPLAYQRSLWTPPAYYRDHPQDVRHRTVQSRKPPPMATRLIKADPDSATSPSKFVIKHTYTWSNKSFAGSLCVIKLSIKLIRGSVGGAGEWLHFCMLRTLLSCPLALSMPTCCDS